MGDPACWLGSTCLACGAFLSVGADESRCPRCGHSLDLPGDMQLLSEAGADQPEVDGD
jgi:hypothetical protein